MSFTFTAEEFTRVRHHVRRVEDEAVAGERRAEVLLVAAEQDLVRARSTLANSCQVTQACIDRFVVDTLAQLRRCETSVDQMRRLCGDAREHRLATGRLVTDLRRETDDAGEAAAVDVRPAILVVDDFEDGRDLLCSVLAGAGFVVRTANNGLEAILAAYEMRPAVIVMDVTMPVMDGVEATRLIKKIDQIREARVIAYTGTPLILGGLVDELFAAILPKPSSPDEVLATVRQHVAA